MPMRLVSWNVNGVRAVAKKGFAAWLNSERPDVLCLQETKASPEQLDRGLANPEGYHSFWTSPEKRGYSGVATFCRREPVRTVLGLGDGRFDAEGRVIRTDFEDFALFNVYFPNGKASPERLRFKLDFYDRFLEAAESVRAMGLPVIFCGDVNTAHKAIDLEHPKANESVSGFLPVERAWMDRVVEAGYVDSLRAFDPSPRKYTWWDYKTGARARNVGWRLDYFFLSRELLPRLRSADILSDVMGSDHCPVSIELD